MLAELSSQPEAITMAEGPKGCGTMTLPKNRLSRTANRNLLLLAGSSPRERETFFVSMNRTFKNGAVVLFWLYPLP